MSAVEEINCTTPMGQIGEMVKYLICLIHGSGREMGKGIKVWTHGIRNSITEKACEDEGKGMYEQRVVPVCTKTGLTALHFVDTKSRSQ